MIKKHLDSVPDLLETAWVQSVAGLRRVRSVCLISDSSDRIIQCQVRGRNVRDMKELKIYLIVLTAMAATARNGFTLGQQERTLFSEPQDAIPGPKMNYTGFRVREDSMLVIYYHEQTIAVVEVGPARELYNCELLEVRTMIDQKVTLDSLKPKIPVQIKISFMDMLDLMGRCQKLDVDYPDQTLSPASERKREPVKIQDLKYVDAGEFSSVFRGVFPGTKWCGNGNVASSYYSLGSDRELDKCCRTHDLCPVKVLGFRTQYNLTNYMFYTKSHCDCDEMFYNCLKNVNSPTANFSGRVFFNILKPMCVEDVPSEMATSNMKRFAWKHKPY